MSERKTFLHYIIPSIGATMVTALYVVVDGIFVGRGVGPQALAAINLSYPYITILFAASAMLAMGGAAITAINFGRGNSKAANRSFAVTFKLVIYFTILISAISVAFAEFFAELMGANAALLADTATYIRYYTLFSSFYCLAMLLAVFVRNDANPRLSLWGMLIGAIANVFFDWLFIFPLNMGLMGAAIASGLGQILSVFVLLSHFWRKRGLLRFNKTSLSFAITKDICKVGFPEFISQMSLAVTIFCYNLIVLKYYGEVGVSAFGVVCYLLEIVIAVFLGVSQGSQPLLSRRYGAKDVLGEKHYLKMAFTANLLLSVITYLLMLVFGRSIIFIFNPDPTLINLGYKFFCYYGFSFIFASVNIVFTTYFLATKRTGRSIIIAVLRSLFLNALLAFLFPLLLGKAAIWLGISATEIIVMLIAVILYKLPPSKLQHNKKRRVSSSEPLLVK
ncbi:MAG: MATE family efflux transporter [Clostridia bacterium]|nr:MATE family efflux transporter [Clostridia bacterium]MDD4797910.1 MATE family efflux transporter [Clostridia bacterium]